MLDILRKVSLYVRLHGQGLGGSEGTCKHAQPYFLVMYASAPSKQTGTQQTKE